MRDWGGNQPTESAFRRLLNALTQSAEYAVAAALLAVVLIVAATWWVRSNRKPEQAPSLPAVAQTSPQAVADETAQRQAEEESAVRDLQQNLEARAAEAERRRQQQMQAEEEARRRSEDARAREAEQARLAAAQAEKQATPKTTVSKAPATTVAKAEPAAPLPAAPRVVTRAAAVDWSTCKRPEYPPRSVERREEGTTVLQVSVSADGKVLDSKIAESSGFDPLDQRALRAVSKCTFKPATTGGVPEASSTQVRFAWKLGR
jgi:periplasmic protein TonB